MQSPSDSANISRRSEERPLVSASELLRFPLDRVLVLAEGQYPIKVNHIRHYENRHFRAVDVARNGNALTSPVLTLPIADRLPTMRKVVAASNASDILSETALYGEEQIYRIEVERASLGALKVDAQKRKHCALGEKKKSGNRGAEAKKAVG